MPRYNINLSRSRIMAILIATGALLFVLGYLWAGAAPPEHTGRA